MKITEVKIRKVFSDRVLKAAVSITVGEHFVIHDVKIIQGRERIFVAMPSRKDENGVYRDIVHPISEEFRQAIEKAVLDEYYRYTADVRAQETDEN
ncbi:MAG: septation regulator SpoVG [Oscillospiraceae bacterium]|jgi:stage V sporulation protein G|nr:septation regulator SpoVG [Oscillospiraceae bacterium]